MNCFTDNDIYLYGGCYPLSHIDSLRKKKNFYSLFFSHHVHVNSSLTWRSFSLYLFVRFAHATDSACLILNKRCKLFVSPLIYTRVVTALNLPTTHHLIHTGGRKRWCIDAIALRRLELQSSMLSPLVWIQRPIDLFVVTTKTTTFFVARARTYRSKITNKIGPMFPVIWVATQSKYPEFICLKIWNHDGHEIGCERWNRLKCQRMSSIIVFRVEFFYFKSHSDSFGAWTMDGTIKLSILFQLVTNWSSLGSLFIFLRRFVQWPNRNSDTRIKHIHKVQSQHKKLLSQISGHSRTLYIQLPVRSMFYYFLFIGISSSFGRNDLMIDRFRLIFVDFKKVPIVRKKTKFFLKSCVFKHFHVTCDSITK